MPSEAKTAPERPDTDAETTNVVKTDFGGDKKRGSIRDRATKRGEYLVMPLVELTIEAGWNKRDMTTEDTKAHVQELAESMAKIDPDTGKPRGIMKPLTYAQKDGLILIRSGHCRMAAVPIANAILESMGVEDRIVEAKIMPATGSDYEQALGQYHDNSNMEFTPIDKGAHYIWLRDEFGKSVKEIAADIGKSTAHVLQCIEYKTKLGGDPEIMSLIHSGYVRVSLAMNVLQNNDGDIESGLMVLRGSIAIAQKLGAPKCMPKHTKMFIKQHQAENPELYDTGEEGQEEAPPADQAAAPASTGAKTNGGSAGRDGGGGESSREAGTTPRATRGGGVGRDETPDWTEKDEILDAVATLLEKHKKAIFNVIPDIGKGTIEKFLRGQLLGKWCTR